MVAAVFKLVAAGILPVLLTIGVFLLDTKTRFKNMRYIAKQAIIGVIFGCSAIFATELSVQIKDAGINVRDASPIAAGLFFGGPAGIIAGVIGGAERALSVLWGGGKYTAVACSVSTVVAGLLAASVRRLSADKHSSLIFGLFIGIAAEAFHMLMIFMTHMDDTHTAFGYVKACSLIMICAVGASTLASTIAVKLLSNERLFPAREKLHLSHLFQLLLSLSMLVAFSATFLLTYFIQTSFAKDDIDKELAKTYRSLSAEFESIEGADGSTDTSITEMIKNIYVWENGFTTLCDSDMNVICTRENTEDIVKDIASVPALSGAKDGEKGRVTLAGADYSFTSFSCANGRVFIFVSEDDGFIDRDVSCYMMMFMEFIVFTVLFITLCALLRRHVTDKIQTVNDGLSKITSGKLDVEIDVRSNAELSSLSDDINTTVSTLKRYIKDAETRIDRELELAKQIQYSTLPSVFPPYPERTEFDIYATMQTAKEVGGDFYDFYMTDGRLAILVADVSSKGIPAAMFMMRAKTLLKDLTERGKALADVFEEANVALCSNNDAGMFVTAWMGLLDTNTGKLQYVNAGHNPPLLLRADGSSEYVKNRSGFILAGMDGSKYTGHELAMRPGDKLFLYTDGVTEAQDPGYELYGEARLEQACRGAYSARELCGAVKSDVERFSNGAEQADDITMLCVSLNSAADGAITTAASLDCLPVATRYIDRRADELAAAAAVRSRLQIAADEILSNIARYSGANTMSVSCAKSGKNIKLVFTDDGKPFDPTAADQADTSLPAEEREVGGLGLTMVKKSAKSMKYAYKGGRNVLTLEYVS